MTDFSSEVQDFEDLEQAVFQTMGAVSACWDDLQRAGVFESERAKAYCDRLVEWIKAHYDERSDNPLLGLATTQQLLEEVATRMEVSQNSTGGRRLAIDCREAVRSLDLRVLAYRTVDS